MARPCRPIWIVAIVLLIVAAARAATVRVSYLVEARHFFEASPRAARSLLFELYPGSGCAGAPLEQEFVTVEPVAVARPRAGRRSTRAARSPPELRLETEIALETPPPVLSLRVTGLGVKAVGGTCQQQSTRLAAPHVRPASCPRDAVLSDGLCVDRYEASLWEIPASQVDLIRQVTAGDATLSDLRVPGVRQAGFPGPPFGHAPIPGSFLPEGAYTTRLYAASIPGVLPSTLVSAYQAWAACGFSGKRLLTTAEWSAAADGTPTPSADDAASGCNVGVGVLAAGVPVKTGSRPRCVSSAGAFDMVGNVSEWTMDGYTTTRYRGGAWDAGDEAGVSFTQPDVPLTQDNAVGFRCAR